jgi:hypothetical protein
MNTWKGMYGVSDSRMVWTAERFILEPHEYMEGCAWSGCAQNGSRLQEYLFWHLHLHRNTWKGMYGVGLFRMGLEIFVPELQSTQEYVEHDVWAWCSEWVCLEFVPVWCLNPDTNMWKGMYRVSVSRMVQNDLFQSI